MTANARADARDVALETARHVSRGALLSRALGRALDASGLASRERALVTDLVYGSLRWRIWLDAALAPRLRDPGALPDDVREALRLGAYEKLIRGTPPHAAVSAWVDVVRVRSPRLTGLVNAVLRRVEPPADPSPAVRASLPRALWRRIEAALGPQAEAAVDAMHAPAPLWLVDHAGDAAERLAADGSEVAPGPLPGTLRVRPFARLGDLPAFRDGAVQPMNPASYAVTRILDAPAGARVLDLCSGRGVKTAALASAGARVEAIERDPGKVDQARRNLARLGVQAEHRVADLSRPLPDATPASHVLLDAPCSGTGTLRGHPEIALRFSEDALAEGARLQERLLDGAAELVAPDGALVYAVCALTPEEGPERVAAFLDRHGDFTPEPVDSGLPQRAAGPGAFLLPLDGLDGFYVARLRRTG
jgi:16S rRNA (cytosine967-C5)-methyltransferase